MKKSHTKSPCCQGEIIKFGKRRRQCKLCKKTWRIRKKKRGRDAKRPAIDFFRKYINKEIPTIYRLSKIKHKQSKDQLKRKIRKGLLAFIENTAWAQIPLAEPLIAIADAMIANINKKTYAIYFILLRPVKSQTAFITEPYVMIGNESWLGWQRAFNRLRNKISQQIRALVSDGHTGLISAAKQNCWKIQRCNFHIIAKIQGRRSRWAKGRHQKEGRLLYKLVDCILTEQSLKKVKVALNKIEKIKQETKSRQLKTYISGFIRHYEEYRTYLNYPELNLPRTSNSAEVTVRYVRDICNKAHGFRTIKAMKLWTFAVLKNKQTITCNGFHQPN